MFQACRALLASVEHVCQMVGKIKQRRTVNARLRQDRVGGLGCLGGAEVWTSGPLGRGLEQWYRICGICLCCHLLSNNTKCDAEGGTGGQKEAGRELWEPLTSLLSGLGLET